MEDTKEERTDVVTEEKTEVEVIDADSVETEQEDIASQFEKWMKNPLVRIAVKDPRLCRFIGDLLDDVPADRAVATNFTPDMTITELPQSLFGAEKLSRKIKDKVLDAYNLCRTEIPTTEAVEMLVKAVEYDNAVDEAYNKGRIDGRNEIIGEYRKRRNVPITDYGRPAETRK